MLYRMVLSLFSLFLFSSNSSADDKAIATTLSAAPDSLSRNATVMDWDGNVLREGTNGWTCLPDIPDNGGNDPWCVDESWLDLLKALKNKTDPTDTKVGIAYMLMGDAPVSNTDPYATAKTNDADWVAGLGAHLMILVPDKKMLEGISHDPKIGGPWIMWPDTPYAHIMVPVESYPK